MTNRDKLKTLSNEELTRFMLYDLPCIIHAYTNSERGLNDWLSSPYVWSDFRVSKHPEYSKYIEELSK